MNTRKGLGWLLFLGVAGVIAWAPGHWFQEPEEATALPVRPTNAAQSGSPAQGVAGKAPAAHSRAAAAKSVQPQADLFAAHSWKRAPVLASVAAPVASAPLPVAAPSAPPLPFQFIGKLDDRNDVQVFLQNGEKLYVVRSGDVIDDTYRIEGISATEMNLVYLPLHLSQTLSVGSAP